MTYGQSTTGPAFQQFAPKPEPQEDQGCKTVPRRHVNTQTKRIALFSFWVSDSNEFFHYHPTFFASFCQNSDLVDLYFIKLGPGPSMGTFKQFICANVFITKFNSSFFWETVSPIIEPHMSQVLLKGLRAIGRQPWEMGMLRVAICSVFQALWPGLWDPYSHWGWIESDTVVGKFSDFLTEAHLEDYDVVCSTEWSTQHIRTMLHLSGQFTILKNTPFLNKLWQPCWKSIDKNLPNPTIYIHDEGSFTDCVLSQAVRHTSKTNSNMMKSPWLSAYREECGLPGFPGVTPANNTTYFTAQEAEVCEERKLEPFLKVIWMRSLINFKFHGTVLYKGKLLTQSHKCKEHARYRSDVWEGRGVTAPDQYICHMNFSYHISGSYFGASWVPESNRHAFGTTAGSDSIWFPLSFSDCDFVYKGGEIHSVSPGTTVQAVYERVANYSYRSPTLGGMVFSHEPALAELPEWDDPECLTSVMLMHLSQVKNSAEMKAGLLTTHPPLHSPIKESDLLVVMANATYILFRSFAVGTQLNLFGNSRYCGPFCIQF